MLKTVSSVANALGALNYKGTWNASTNTPTLASGVGNQGDYYVVSVAGATDLDGITNWGVGDWAAFNGSVWQRVEGGADGNFVNLDVTNAATFNTVYASTSVAVGNPANYQATFYKVGANANYVQVANGITGAAAGNGILYGVDAAGNGVLNKQGAGDLITTVAGIERLRILQAGTLDVSAANIAFDSGYGIDFSATAGTGTSELLDDYEEGTWTPTYTTSGTDFDSVTYGIQTGSYVKIGELVTVFCAIRTNSLTVGSGTGNVRVGGLPFTVGSTADQWNNATAIRAGFVDATNFELVSCFGTEAVPRDISNNQAALTDLDTGANDNHLTFTLSYRV
jgi:hypothetical protein